MWLDNEIPICTYVIPIFQTVNSFLKNRYTYMQTLLACVTTHGNIPHSQSTLLCDGQK
jgi:hypothetical protein